MSKKNEPSPQMINLKTVDIRGKAYVQVHERIRIFRQDQQYKGWQLITTAIQLDDNVATFKAEIINDKGVVVASGHARELKESSYINKTSYVENAETSAMGRALGNLGIGVETSFCTADELLVAMQAQNDNQSKQAPKPVQQVKPEPIVNKVATISQEQISKIQDLEHALGLPPANLQTMNFEAAKKYFMVLVNEVKKREQGEHNA